MVRNPLMNKSMAVKYARNLAHMRENKILYRSLVGEDWTEEYVTWKTFSWKDTKMDLIWTGWKDVGWIHLAPDTDKWQAFV